MIFVFDEKSGKRTRYCKGDRVEVAVLGGSVVTGKVVEAEGMRLDETSIKDMLFKKNYHHFLMRPVIVDGSRGAHYLHVTAQLGKPPEVPTLPVPARVTVVGAAGGDEDEGPGEAELKLVAVIRRAALGISGDEYLLCLMAP